MTEFVSFSREGVRKSRGWDALMQRYRERWALDRLLEYERRFVQPVAEEAGNLKEEASR